jgi:gluconokinase
MIVVTMGVCGCGKTTVGELLAERMGWEFYDADNFHSEQNKKKMNQGIPLTDEDRLPWLAALRGLLQESEREGRSIVLACSALREKFRRDLADGLDVKYAYLHGSKDLIAERLTHRTDHYMNPALLDSQFAALEEPKDAIYCDVAKDPEEIVEELIEELKASL